MHLNPIALRIAKTLWSFGHSECNRYRVLAILSAIGMSFGHSECNRYGVLAILSAKGMEFWPF